MIGFNKTRLNTLYLEIKNRVFYSVFSFFICFLVAYKNSSALLYLFVSRDSVMPLSMCKAQTSYVLSPSQENRIANWAQLFIASTNSDSSSIFSSYSCDWHRFSYDYRHFPVRGEPVLCFASPKVLQSTEQQQLSCDSLFSVRLPSLLVRLTSHETIRGEPCDNLLWLSKLNNIELVSIFSDQDLVKLAAILDSVNLSSIQFIFTDVEEAFTSKILICLIFSCLFSVIYIVYTCFAFLAPSLSHSETKRLIRKTTLFIGVWICFVVSIQNKVIPKFAQFLLDFQIQEVGFNINAETRIYAYLIWATTIFFIANLIFFFCCLIIIFVVNGKLEISFWLLHRKWYALLLFLISALISPPDLVAQLILGVLFVFCFELLICVFLIYKNFNVY